MGVCAVRSYVDVRAECDEGPLSALRVGLGGCGLYPFAAPYRGEVVNIPNLFFDQNYQIAPTGSDPSTRLPGGRDQATNCAALRFA